MAPRSQLAIVGELSSDVTAAAAEIVPDVACASSVSSSSWDESDVERDASGESPTKAKPKRQKAPRRSKDDGSSSPISRLTPPPGFRNTGNTCYANAALQCMLNTALSHALLDPKTASIFRRYSSNPRLLAMGSGSVDEGENEETVGENDDGEAFTFIATSSTSMDTTNDDSLSSAMLKQQRRHRQKRQLKADKRKEKERQEMRETCRWLTTELTNITREYAILSQRKEDTAERKTLSSKKRRDDSSASSAVGFVLSLVGISVNTEDMSLSGSMGSIVDPGRITRHVDRLSRCLRPNQQEDAHEFLRALLSALIMEGENRKLSALFDGLLESAVTCQTCRKSSLTRDRYMDLSLEIAPSTITDLSSALKDFTRTEILDGDNKVYCSRCKTKRTVTKGLRLATAPTILVCHLKRFAYNKYGRLVRLSKHVKFPLRLEIGNFMSRGNRSTPPPYALVGVLVHAGSSCDSGHYLSYVRAGCGDTATWYCTNDSVVTKVSVETVLEQRAYILVYEVDGMKERHGFTGYSRYEDPQVSGGVGLSTSAASTKPKAPSRESDNVLSGFTGCGGHTQENFFRNAGVSIFQQGLCGDITQVDDGISHHSHRATSTRGTSAQQASCAPSRVVRRNKSEGLIGGRMDDPIDEEATLKQRGEGSTSDDAEDGYLQGAFCFDICNRHLVTYERNPRHNKPSRDSTCFGGSLESQEGELFNPFGLELEPPPKQEANAINTDSPLKKSTSSGNLKDAEKAAARPYRRNRKLDFVRSDDLSPRSDMSEDDTGVSDAEASGSIGSSHHGQNNRRSSSLSRVSSNRRLRVSPPYRKPRSFPKTRPRSPMPSVSMIDPPGMTTVDGLARSASYRRGSRSISADRDQSASRGRRDAELPPLHQSPRP